MLTWISKGTLQCFLLNNEFLSVGCLVQQFRCLWDARVLCCSPWVQVSAPLPSSAILGGSKWWFRCLVSCHPHGGLDCVPGACFCLAQPQPAFAGIWGMNQHLEGRMRVLCPSSLSSPSPFKTNRRKIFKESPVIFTTEVGEAGRGKRLRDAIGQFC